MCENEKTGQHSHAEKPGALAHVGPCPWVHTGSPGPALSTLAVRDLASTCKPASLSLALIQGR